MLEGIVSLSLLTVCLCYGRFFFFFFLMIRPPPSSPLFPSTPLSRSGTAARGPARVVPRSAFPLPRSSPHPPHIPPHRCERDQDHHPAHHPRGREQQHRRADRKSTRLNSSHSQISYAVFCLKKKNKST